VQFWSTMCTFMTLDWFIETINECLQEDAKHRPYVSEVINRLANYEGGVVPHFEGEDDDDMENTSDQKKKKKKKAAKVVIVCINFCS